MKTLLLTLTYLVGAGELILAIYFWATKSKNEVRKVMALLAFSTGIWVVTNGLTSYVQQTSSNIIFGKLVFISGVVLISSLLHFVLIYPIPLFRMDRWHAILLYVPGILFSIIIATTNAVYKGFTGSTQDSGQVIPGPIYNIYNLYIILLFVASLILLIYRARLSDGLIRRNAIFFFWAVLLGGLPAVIIDLFISSFVRDIKPNALYGVISSVVWLGTTTLIILRKNP